MLRGDEPDAHRYTNAGTWAWEGLDPHPQPSTEDFKGSWRQGRLAYIIGSTDDYSVHELIGSLT